MNSFFQSSRFVPSQTALVAPFGIATGPATLEGVVLHYYPFHIADFALHTSHLSLEEEAVYRRLLDYYYDTESPIPKKTQSVIRRLRLGSYEETVGSILEEFFVLKDDGWHNLRADIEISDYNSRAETARNNGKKGGRPKKNKGLETKSVILANPDQTQKKANQEPVTKNHKPRTRENARAGSFPMNLDWTPEPQTWEGNCYRSGCQPDYQNHIHEFRLYWQNREEVKLNEHGWQGKLINTLKNQYQRTRIEKSQPAQMSPISEELYKI